MLVQSVKPGLSPHRSDSQEVKDPLFSAIFSVVSHPLFYLSSSTNKPLSLFKWNWVAPKAFLDASLSLRSPIKKNQGETAEQRAVARKTEKRRALARAIIGQQVAAIIQRVAAIGQQIEPPHS